MLQRRGKKSQGDRKGAWYFDGLRKKETADTQQQPLNNGEGGKGELASGKEGGELCPGKGIKRQQRRIRRARVQRN